MARLGENGGVANAPEVQSLIATYLAQICEILVLAWSPERIILGEGIINAAPLHQSIEAILRERIGRYGEAGRFSASPFLSAPAFSDPGLEGAMLPARGAAATT